MEDLSVSWWSAGQWRTRGKAGGWWFFNTLFHVELLSGSGSLYSFLQLIICLDMDYYVSNVPS